MAGLCIRSLLQKQFGFVRQGIFGASNRWIQRSSHMFDDKKKINQSTDAEKSSPGTETSSDKDEPKYFGDETVFFEADEEEGDDVREKILNAALEHVSEFGWSSEAIEAGAQAIGLSAMAEGMFPHGAGELVLHFIEDCNVRLADHLVTESRAENDSEKDPSVSPARKSSRVIIRDAVEVRLRMLIPYIEQWPQAMGLMLLPYNAPDAAKNVAYLVDEIWYHAGDTSTDINWYAKRGVLAGLYGATELYMISDNSHDFEGTWSFLDRRMSDIGMMISAKETIEKAGSDTAELLSAAFTTVRNMSGLNSRNR
ncbi:ubiquinone biosynthesis protein COQ9-B, mitochondrial-like isoform X1 [Acropora palmata]|uniref:ubiquinone biosynthesis protein COQ9-B, mitochondrial-like isoform X1 n=1 Tax=Acropora palmata TaxID=6131 RepID=UPI003DA1962E